MNEKQQIAEAERRFERWWDAEGVDKLSATSLKHIKYSEWLEVKAVTKEAWMNGAFVARENN